MRRTIAHSVRGYLEAKIHGEISFAGLPAGYSIQSCHGYVGQPVPALARSWGALKAGYR